jgi:two-component system sensor histidine kinase KdpD
MFVVALVISGLTVRIRWLGESARHREQRTAALYALSRELASTRGVEPILNAAIRHIKEVFRGQVVVLLPDPGGQLLPDTRLDGGFPLSPTELGVGRWAYEHRQPAGLGTSTLPGASALYLPLTASRGTLGVLGFRPTDPQTLTTPEQVHQLETFVNQTALALERGKLADEAREAQIRIETERLRGALLSSVSHDLRTPLASITGSLSSLSDNHNLDDATQRELVETALGEAERLNRLVGNLLDMTRLEAGIVRVAKEPYDVQDVIGVSLQEIGSLAEGRQVVVNVPSGMPLVPMDLVLIARVLFNVLDNAIKYSAPGTPIEISARSLDTYVEIEVADRGMGIPEGDLNHVFDKFYRVQRPNHVTGTGLGLSISKGLVEAHGGRIWANKREGGGTAVTLILPLS